MGDRRDPRVRAVVAESWVRSSAAGVDPDRHLAPVVLDGSTLTDYRSAHPLSAVFPLLYDVLGRAAVDCDCVMAVGDADGKLLWVSGSREVMRKAERIHFVEGSVWDEDNAGTNAPGMALHLDAPSQVHSTEHYNRLIAKWSCSAAPIHDPQTGAILGLVDITGGPDVATPQTLAMVRAAARMAESELARLAASGEGRRQLWVPPASDARVPDTVRLQGLGLPDLIVTMGRRTLRLTPRHSEILAVLVDHPAGLTAEQLEIEVYAAHVHSSTMRAEMARLRGLLGEAVLQSRPYRLVVDASCDWKDVQAQVAAGRVREALQSYRGAVVAAVGVARRRRASGVGAGPTAGGRAGIGAARPHGRVDAITLGSRRRADVAAPTHGSPGVVAVATGRSGGGRPLGP
jgi:transcriptional regulator of acetoin/glycerol metabolism